MDTVLRGAATYAFIWLILRIAGKRTLANITSFDFVLLLIISETVQGALMRDDPSMTNSFLLIITLVGMDIGLSLVKQRWQVVEKTLDGTPLLIVENGRLLRERMNRERIDEDDILTAARQLHGLYRLDQIKFAILERDGGISIVPAEKAGA